MTAATILPPARASAALKVSVNVSACQRLAELLARHDVPIDREEANLANYSARQAGNFNLAVVAICHQTSPKGQLPLCGTVNGKSLKGWDYLWTRFEEAAIADPELLSPNTWSQIACTDLIRLFRDSECGDRLVDPEGRARLLRDLGAGMLKNQWQYLDDLYELSGHRVATGDPNLLDLLANFRAYDDPVRKKSYFLLSLMRNGGYWKYVDDELLGPPVDYHEVRGHLRIGTVTVNDPSLYEKLLNSAVVCAEDDVAIRSAVHDAIMLISSLSGIHNPSRLHYLFWNVFRSCCTRQSPHCRQCPPGCGLPPRYVQLNLKITGDRRCMFSPVCQSAGREPKLLEHAFSTDYY